MFFKNIGKIEWYQTLTQGVNMQAWEWISDFIPHYITMYTMDTISYPCWDQGESILVKGSQKKHDENFKHGI